MWRAFFLAIGITTMLVGLQCLVVDKALLASRGAEAVAGGAGAMREFVPPEWAPWSLISLGVVVILYSFTVPKKLQG